MKKNRHSRNGRAAKKRTAKRRTPAAVTTTVTVQRKAVRKKNPGTTPRNTYRFHVKPKYEGFRPFRAAMDAKSREEAKDKLRKAYPSSRYTLGTSPAPKRNPIRGRGKIKRNRTAAKGKKRVTGTSASKRRPRMARNRSRPAKKNPKRPMHAMVIFEGNGRLRYIGEDPGGKLYLTNEFVEGAWFSLARARRIRDAFSRRYGRGFALFLS